VLFLLRVAHVCLLPALMQQCAASMHAHADFYFFATAHVSHACILQVADHSLLSALMAQG
jgi:hypothetical protein